MLPASGVDSLCELLFDENLSRKLGPRLEHLFPGSRHVSSEGLGRVPDRKIWDFANAHDFVTVTADGDYFGLMSRFGPPPKVIWLRGCDYPTVVAEELIRRQSIRVGEFWRDPDHGVLVLRP